MMNYQSTVFSFQFSASMVQPTEKLETENCLDNTNIRFDGIQSATELCASIADLQFGATAA
jgi:hypothetical protein